MNFSPAKNFSFSDNKIILPKWLISEFLRHRKFVFNDSIWYDELNEQYGVILPHQFKRMAQKIGYGVKLSQNIGSLLDKNNKYNLSSSDFIIEPLNNISLSKEDFPCNFVSVLYKY